MTRELERLVDQVAKGFLSGGTVRERILALEERRRGLRAELAGMAPPANIVALHPGAVARYLALIEQVGEGGEMKAAACSAAFRELVDSVIVHPTPPRSPLDIELLGYLAKLTEEPRLVPSGRHSGFMVVAEVRYHRSPRHDLPAFTVDVALA